ncbi:MAG: peptide ABC transporter substrate-binding protein, partial [Clostridia bacterium]
MKRVLSVILSLVMLMSLVSVTALADEAKQGGTLTVGEYILDTQMSNKNPYVTNGTWNSNLRTLIYDALVYYNPLSGEYSPVLAEEWSWNDDYTQMTFKIREGVKWHDGEPFTAADVAFTYNMIKDTTLDVYGLWKHFDSVTADGSTVVVTCKSAFPSLLSYVSELYIVPEHLWASVGNVPEYLNDSPVGTGAFIWSKYTVGTDIQFSANKEYFQGAPNVDRLVIMMYNSSPNMSLSLLKGEIDMSFGTITMSNIPEFLTKDNAKMQIYAGTTNWVVSFNFENELLADREVRKAMCMAIDQNSLITKAEYNGVFPVNMGWLPNLFGDLVNQEANAQLTYDPAAAREVLETAGYTLGDDGVYQKDGKRLSFTYHNASGAPAQQMEAGMIQQWLLNIGIEIIPKLATWAELASLRQNGKYDLLQNNYAFPADPYAALNSCFNSSMTAPSGEPTPGNNHFRYRNAELDVLLDEMAVETDAAKSKELYYKAQEIIAGDYVGLPMYNQGDHIPYYNGGRIGGWRDDVP